MDMLYSNSKKGGKSMVLKNLGVISDEVSSDLIESLDWIQNEGLKYVEIRMVDRINVSNLSDEQAERVLAETEKRGLGISALASPLFKCALDSSRPVATGDKFGQEEESVEAHFTKLDRTIEIAKKLKTNHIRIFSFWREKDPALYVNEIAILLKKTAQIAEKENVLLLLENEGSCNGGSAEEVAKLVKRVNSSSLKALWDPGNEQHGGRNSFPAGYLEVRDVIAHVHLKDALVDEEGKPRCLPIGSGQVNYIDQLKALQDDGYRGLYIIETHYIPDDGTKMDGTKMSLEGLRALMKEGGIT
jgi:L-ribulose-5-phosphate 3-epimerase